MRYLPALIIFVLFPHAAVADDGKPPEIALRCNKVKWEVHMDSSDRYPAALRKIQAELAAAGPKIMVQIEDGLRFSLHLRRIAASVVARWPGDRCRRILLVLLKDTDTFVGPEAAHHLGVVGGQEVIDPLVKALKTSRVAMVRHNALNSLGRMGQANRAFDGAVDCLSHEQSWVRHSAVQLIEKVDGEAVAKAGIEKLTAIAGKETNPGVKKAIARALRILKAKSE